MICAKIGPLHEAEPPYPLLFVENFRAGDVRRHQVGRELNALEVEVEDLGERLDQQRLGQARHAGDQAMAAGEQRDQDLFDDLVLADDDLAELGRICSRPSATFSAVVATSMIVGTGTSA